MPRYVFDVADRRPHDDDEGQDCRDDEAARAPAILSLTAIAAETIPRSRGDRSITINVRDQAGQGVYKATLTCAGRMLR